MGNERAVGAILAGGRSTRMGTAKAVVELAGRPLLLRAVAAVEAASLEAVVVAKPDSPLPRFEGRVVHESPEPLHPLRGIVTALEVAGGRPVVALACDMPLVPAPLLEWLAGLKSATAVVRAGGRIQPLLARYEPAVAPALARAMAADAPAHEAVSQLDPRVIAEDELARFGDPELICLNVNTPADLERAEAVTAASSSRARR
ncbi:MAG TPA: molybdenum cofactor guanylyltransferase [Solirubrobacterales bacterium]|nr:molybdenum cofactor guanylyltransferase [Solirubrobacterales bacterium]